jgi:hypothetical protein
MENKFIFGSFSVATDNVSAAFTPTFGAKSEISVKAIQALVRTIKYIFYST